MFLASISAGTGTTGSFVYASSVPGIDLTGTIDSRAALNSLIQGTAGTGKTLVIDCPILISIGNNVAAPIFVPNFLSVDFTPSGMFIVDNILIPAFCFLHTTDNTWNNPHIRYVGTLPLDASATSANYQYFSTWNDGPVKTRMVLPVSSGGFGNTFTGTGSAYFSAAVDGMAVFNFRGQCARNTFNHLLMDVPTYQVDGVTPTLATSFIPCAVSIDPEWIPGTTVPSNSQQLTAANAVIPSKIIFNQPIFDGFLMGLIGPGGFEMNQPVFKRYSDLQDASYVTNGVGGSQGGVNTWFPSPHCICAQSPQVATAADALALTQTKVINDGFDFGIYVGGTTRRSPSAGWASALRISPDGGTRVNGFKTMRAEGLIDVLSYNALGTPGGGELNNLIAGAYDSSLLHVGGGSNPVVRFPDANLYQNILINKLSITDVAATPATFGITGLGVISDYAVSITNLEYFLKDMPADNTWGFSTSGSGMTVTGDIYLANCTNTSTNKGLISTTAGTGLTSGYLNLRVWGWRVINSLTFTAPPSGSSGTLSANWLLPTDAYVVKFPSGQQRLVTLTLNSSAATWSQALPAAETGASFIVNCINVNNVNSMRQLLSISSPGYISTSVRALVKDMSNGLTQECDNGIVTETWTQQYGGAPLGATQATTISFPSTFSIDRVGCAVSTTLGTVTSFGVGWTGSPTALLATQSNSSASNAATAVDTTWPRSLGGSAQNILLTPTSGSFDGTGMLRINVRGVRMYCI